jgi:hypothetical protein
VGATKLDAAINLQKELNCNFTDDMDVDKRLLLIELENLNETSTLSLVKCLLHDQVFDPPKDLNILNTVFNLSGGNPLYAVEAIYAVIKILKESPYKKLDVESECLDTTYLENVRNNIKIDEREVYKCIYTYMCIHVYV